MQSPVDFPGDRRLHVALNVASLERSERFYQILLGVDPAKKRPGYVKFEPDDPSVNLTLNENEVDGGGRRGVSHFGIQVKSSEEVAAATKRFRNTGLGIVVEEGTTCCYAVQDKVWVTDPDGNQWEIFTVLEKDADERASSTSTCCSTQGDASDSCC